MYEAQAANKRDSIILITSMGTLMILGGVLVGLYFSPDSVGAMSGGAIAFSIWAVMTIVTVTRGDKMMLGFSGAKRVDRKDHAQLFNVIEEMCIASGMPMPKVYIIDDTAPNAFATGMKPETASIAVTRGLLMKLNRAELQGVIAHEMSHIKNRDIMYMVVTGIMLGVIVLMCDFFQRGLFFGSHRSGRSRSNGKGVPAVQIAMLVLVILFSILAPILAKLLFFAVSRKREFLADACAAEMTRYPDALADALEKISGDQEVLEVANRATSALYICNPIKKFEKRAKKLTSTHPPIEERIKILRAIGRGGNVSFLEYNTMYKQLSSYHAKEIVPEAAVKRAAKNVPVLESLSDLKNPPRTQEQQLERLRDIQRLVIATAGVGSLSCACGFVMPLEQFTALKLFHEESTGNVPGLVRCKDCGKMMADPTDKDKLNDDAKGISSHEKEDEKNEKDEHFQIMRRIQAHDSDVS